MMNSNERAEQKRLELENALRRKPPMAVRCTRFLLSAVLIVGLSVWSIPSVLAFSSDAAKGLLSRAQEVEGSIPEETAEYEKTEVVYATLSATGQMEAMYVVNRFDVAKEGVIVDFGSYDAVSNLTDDAGVVRNGDASIIDTDEGVFFYQGDTVESASAFAEAKLPWKVSLSYQLDGRDVQPADIAGASGDLSIRIKTMSNDAADPAFFDSYMLQITFTLDGDTCSDVQAEGATTAFSGRNRTIAFTALPGKEGDFTVTAKVRDFEMAGVQIAALPYSMVMEMPDTDEMMEGMTSLSDAINQLSGGTAALAEGANSLASGANSLASGAGEFGDGLGQLNDAAHDLAGASNEINAALGMVAEGLASADLGFITEIAELPAALRALADALSGDEDVASPTTAVQGGLEQARLALEQLMAELPQGGEITDEQIELLLEAARNADLEAGGGTDRLQAATELARAYKAASQVRSAYFGYGDYQGVQGAIIEAGELLGIDETGAVGSTQLAELLRKLADAMESFMNDLGVGQLTQLVSGMQELASNYSLFNEGLSGLANGLDTMTTSFGEFESGVSDLAAGTDSFASGAWQLSDGMGALNANTINLPTELREQMEELMADYDFPEFVPRSFVSELNKDTVAVQFVMTTEPIAVPEPPAQEEPEEERLTILDRLLNLFR